MAIEKTILSAAPSEREIAIPTGKKELHGTLAIPPLVKGLVLFAHGSGSSRFSPRNRYVANTLNKAGLATCLFDLLTPEEEREDQLTRALRFNIRMLAERLTLVTGWIHQSLEDEHVGDLNIGYFGASTGAAAALIAAAEKPDLVRAVVSRGGRVDLAEHVLHQVQAPTLLLVGELDDTVVTLNQQAYRQLPLDDKELIIIPGAGHLFEEPGKLEEVAQHSARWFDRHFIF